MKTQRIPLVGSVINRNVNPSAFSTKDQFFTNCYPETVANSITGKAKAYLNKRPGSSAGGALAGVDSPAGASCLWSSNTSVPSPAVFGFINTGLGSTSVWNNSDTKIGGDIANTISCLSLTEASVNGTGTLTGIFIDGSATEAWYFPQGGAWTQITDGDFPPNLGSPENLVGDIIHLNGRAYVMTTNGKIWNSDQNSLANWTASAFNTAQSYPDGGVGLARYKDLIAAFGKYSIEFFQDVGLTPSPIVTIGSSVNRVGIEASGSIGYNKRIFPVGNTVYFIGISSESGTRGVYRLNGFAAEKISNSAIDKLMNGASASSLKIDGIAGAFTAHGMEHLLMYQSGESAINCYCITTNTWWVLNLSQDHTPYTIIGYYGSFYFQTENDAKIHSSLSNNPVFTDAAVAYTQTIQLESMDMGTGKKKFWKRIRPIGDIQSSASALTVSYADDDYTTYTTAGTIDLSSRQAMEQGLTAPNLGSSRRRSWKLTHAANTPNRLEAIDIEFEIGNS